MVKKRKIAVIGLGYVGLPLLIEISKKYECIGYDINKSVIKQLKEKSDKRNIVSAEELKQVSKIKLSSKIEDLKNYNTYIITVPTPLDKFNNPDLEPLKTASVEVGSLLNKDDLVIYESTVYPGCTEEYCIPLLEEASSKILNKEFICGYSPERVNPGDNDRKISQIIKVTSGSNSYAARVVDDIYSKIISAGTYRAKSIKVAEMSKVIENVQRDLNIGLMNEVAIICNKLGLKTSSVLAAANTKWNFLDFKPGLVGGHCISIDPYYLTHKAKELGYHPELILSARKLNDSMPLFVANSIMSSMIQKKIDIKRAKILFIGYAFKENVSDIRNTKVLDLINHFLDLKLNVNIFDPLVIKNKTPKRIKKNFISKINNKKFDVVVLCVQHNIFSKLIEEKFKKLVKKNYIIYDIKSAIPISSNVESL